MGQKDITEKLLEDYNDVFADIINGLIFKGEQRILPESLENAKVHSQYKAEDGKVHELERDVIKYWKEKKVELAICGIENQSNVKKYMPFRIIGYDGAAYRSQLLENRKEILPVMTIVLYFGTDHHWYGKKNIKGLMKIPEGLEEYINDYEMKVFEIAWLTEEEISRFHSDFKVVANFFVQKRKHKDYIPDDPTEIRHIDEVLKLLRVMTGDESSGQCRSYDGSNRSGSLYHKSFNRKNGICPGESCDAAWSFRDGCKRAHRGRGAAFCKDGSGKKCTTDV